MELTLLWAVLTAFAATWIGLRVFDERLPERPMDVLITAGLAAVAAGRVAAMVSSGINPITNLGDFIIIRGGVDTTVATIVFIVTLLWATRDSLGAMDALAPAVLAGLAGWHAGCLWRGACLGTPTSLPWGWAQEGSEIIRHPLEIYAAIGLLLGAYLVSKMGWRPWARAGTALAVASGIRLLSEPLRPSITGGPMIWYLVGVLVGVVVALACSRWELARST